MPTTQRRRAIMLFRRLKFTTQISASEAEDAQLDIDKMMLHCLDCLASLQCVMGQYETARANAFWGAVQTIAEIGLDSGAGHMDQRHPGAMLLLRSFPNEQKATDGRGWLPLHWAAVVDNVNLKDIQKIARSDPMATAKGANQLPLSTTPGHLICAVRHPKMDVLRCLFNFYPRLSSSRDNCDDLPIHYAARYCGSVEVIQYLLQSNPSSTKQRGESDLVPLHCAFFNESSNRLAIVLSLLEADPSAATITSSDGDNALHLAVVQECEIELIDKLLKAFPSAAQMKNHMGLLPLHTACYSKKSLEIVKLLLAAYPEGARLASESGARPANIAAEYSSSEILKELLKVHPDAIFEGSAGENNSGDMSNNTPIMIAVRGENEDCVDFLCTNYPLCVRAENANARNALHVAADGDNVKVLEYLYRASPESIRHRDKFGKLPLHIFAELHRDPILENDTDSACLRFLLKMYPDAVHEQDSRGDRPIDLCDADNLHIRRLLLAADTNIPTDHPEKCRLNYAARRMAIFLAFAAINADGIPNLYLNLRCTDPLLLKHVLTYL